MKKVLTSITVTAAVAGTVFLLPAAAQEKITICHATGSEDNPFVSITISERGLRGHNHHAGDIIPAPPEGCGDLVIE